MFKASFPDRPTRVALLSLVAALAAGGCGSAPADPPLSPEASKAKINARNSFAQETKGAKADNGTSRISNRGRR